MLSADDFARLFRLPPEEAVDYLKRRGLLTETFDWRDLWHEEHLNQFTVSRLARLDLLEAIRDGITRSVEGDLSRRDWMRDIQSLLQKEGWWGEKEVLDQDTGKLVKTVFDPARLKLIYDTNTNMAYSSGLWERIARNKATSPYIRYITKRDEKVRLTHQAWDNLALPVDHPFWNSHFPPNGWRCRCRAMSMSQRDYDTWKAQGRIKTEAPPGATKRWIDKRSGEVHQVPVGIDPGFDYNPGQKALHGKIDLLKQKLIDQVERGGPPVMAAATLNEIFRAGVFDLWYRQMEMRVADALAQPEYAGLDMDTKLKQLRKNLDDKQEWPVAVIDANLARLIDTRAPIVQFSAYDAIKQIVSRSSQDFGPEDYQHVQSVLDSAKLVVELNDVRYAFLPKGRKVYMAVLHVSADRREVYLKSYRHAFAPEEVKALKKRGRVLKEEWDGEAAREGDSP